MTSERFELPFSASKADVLTKLDELVNLYTENNLKPLPQKKQSQE